MSFQLTSDSEHMSMHAEYLLQPTSKSRPGPGGTTAGGRSSDIKPGDIRSAVTPRILLTATLRWPIAARLAIVFAKMGCHVEALCPRQHPVSKTCAIRRLHHSAVLLPLDSLRLAIESATPDLVIPCDDEAAVHLHHLYVRAGVKHHATHALRTLITRSLGSPEACAFATSRGQVMALAADAGVRVPDTVTVADPGEMNSWLMRRGFPAVLKIDSTWGGQGVAIVHNHSEAQHAFAQLTSRPPVVSALARVLLDRDLYHFLNSLGKNQRIATLQSFIPGTPANRAVACWQGKVLAGISVEAIRTQHPTGPASVVRVIENPEMSEAVDRLVRRLGISGLWGVDFILEAKTGAAYMIEMNPRATPICHLALGAGQDLPAALYTQLTGHPPSVASAKIEHSIIAMFPGEWRRKPESPFLRSSYHDIPLDEPALIRDCIDRPWSERGWVARSWARFRPRPLVSLARQSAPVGTNLLKLDTVGSQLFRGRV